MKNNRKSAKSASDDKLRKLKREIRRRGHNNVEVGRTCREILTARPSLSIRGLARELGVHDRTVAFKLTAARLADETGDDTQGAALRFRQAPRYRNFPVKHRANKSPSTDDEDSGRTLKDAYRILAAWHDSGPVGQGLFMAYRNSQTETAYQDFERITRAWNRSSPKGRDEFQDLLSWEAQMDMEEARRRAEMKMRAQQYEAETAGKKNEDNNPAATPYPEAVYRIPADIFDMIADTRLDRTSYHDKLRELTPEEQLAKVKSDLKRRGLKQRRGLWPPASQS